jgi:hypothetical protein
MAGRLFGTNASAENIRDGLKIRVGGCGNGATTRAYVSHKASAA